MVDVTYQMVLSTLQTIALIVGIIYYIMTIRTNQRNQEIALRNQELALEAQKQAIEERRNQFSAEFLRLWSTREFWENWISFLRNMDFSTVEEWSEKYGPYVNPEVSKHWYSLVFYFDKLGRRVNDGQIDLDSALFYVEPFGVLLTWEKSLPIFEEWRERMNYPIMSGFEFLYNETKKKYPTLVSTPKPDRERLMKK